MSLTCLHRYRYTSENFHRHHNRMCCCWASACVCMSASVTTTRSPAKFLSCRIIVITILIITVVMSWNMCNGAKIRVVCSRRLRFSSVKCAVRQHTRWSAANLFYRMGFHICLHSMTIFFVFQRSKCCYRFS